MGAIIIKADSKSNKILSELARKLGGKVLNMKDQQFEDFALGSLMDSVKTGETVTREEIMKKLQRK
jgi:predicted transcriptional regulator